jgi:hypothetical protein
LPDNVCVQARKDYLFTLINTFDPNFFPRLIDEVENLKLAKNPRKPQTVEISDDMLQLLQRFSDIQLHRSSARSLASLKMPNRSKRTRREFDTGMTFHTLIDQAEERRTKCKDARVNTSSKRPWIE